jgi:NADH:ubiquinone oxidoreductase subunit B-like Fe-S oxidoreductase
MNKYLVSVRVGGQTVKTVVFADSTIHARLLCQYKYGMNSIAASPTLVKEVDDAALLDNTIPTIKPKPPTTPAQTRINALKQSVERSKEQLHREREQQHKQREAERTRQQQQKRF